MNTVEIRETAVVENDLAKECILYGVGTLGRGRRPFAKADIVGVEGECETRGSASFYYTPLGMLLCVAVKGLGERGVYSLSLVSGESGREIETRCAIPPLYSRDGYAWCSALTGKLLPSEIRDKKVVMREIGAESDELVAMGTVKSCME